MRQGKGRGALQGQTETVHLQVFPIHSGGHTGASSEASRAEPGRERALPGINEPEMQCKEIGRVHVDIQRGSREVSSVSFSSFV